MSKPLRPQAILLDFGGVLVSTRPRPNGFKELAWEVGQVLERAGCALPDEATIHSDLQRADAAYKSWKMTTFRQLSPLELSPRELWGGFVAGEWPEAARMAVSTAWAPLSALMVRLLTDHTVQPGVRELLAEARSMRIPVSVVSNAISGRAHHAVLSETGLDACIANQLYSDELGIRKPNPTMLTMAAAALGVAPSACWYAGDHYDRDVICAKRAGIGTTILVHDGPDEARPLGEEVEPDAQVSTPVGLYEMLRATDSVPPHGSSGPPSLPVGGPVVGGPVVGGPVVGGPVVGGPAEPEAPGPAGRHRVTKGSERRPRALLLDHGGVVVTSRPDPDGIARFVSRLRSFLVRNGWDRFDEPRLLADLADAKARDRERKAFSDPAHVREITHAEFWRDLVAARWPNHPTAAVTIAARSLTLDYASSRNIREIRPGILPLLQRCAELDVRVGIVSNTLCGEVNRRLAVKLGTAPFLAVEVYSDELGRRKPDPAMITQATAALGLDPGDCWYAGDKVDRDVLCARLAGIGRVVLVDSTKHAIGESRDAPLQQEALLRPDTVIDEPAELRDLLDSV